MSMIDDNTKALALAKLKMSTPIESVAEELNLPVMLVKEWHSKLDLKDLTHLHAGNDAVVRVLNAELLPETSIKLRNALEEAALEVAMRVKDAALYPDLVYATSLDKCASAIAKLYSSIVNNLPAGGTPPSTNNFTFFDNRKD